MRTLTHPRMAQRMGAAMFPSSCTVQVATVTRSAAGAEVKSWADLAGHVAIPCNLAPTPRTVHPVAEQLRRNQTPVITEWDMALQGYYPAITAAHRAVVGGTVYDLESVTHDSQHRFTVLTARVVTP